jgi:hypothetical protein
MSIHSFASMSDDRESLHKSGLSSVVSVCIPRCRLMAGIRENVVAKVECHSILTRMMHFKFIIELVDVIVTCKVEFF